MDPWDLTLSPLMVEDPKVHSLIKPCYSVRGMKLALTPEGYLLLGNVFQSTHVHHVQVI